MPDLQNQIEHIVFGRCWRGSFTIFATIAAVLLGSSASLAQSGIHERWSTGIKFGYGVHKYSERSNLLCAALSTRYSLNTRMKLVAEAGYILYDDPDYWSQWSTSDLTIFPLSLGIRIGFPSGQNTTIPFIQLSPTAVYSHSSIRGGFPGSEPEVYKYSDWTLGAQSDVGIEVPLSPSADLELAVRFLITPDAGSLEDMHHFFGLAGISFQW